MKTKPAEKTSIMDEFQTIPIIKTSGQSLKKYRGHPGKSAGEINPGRVPKLGGDQGGRIIYSLTIK